ncbi:MAG: pilus assembly protein PilP [Deltaproteobacteria bacterium]|nr:pilus assembly protein PilP [Deltaproteobacteria bacterium]MBW1959683.1 pilus assembly protein PilP [Deltaproteobacteria bacterium]MBW2014935.1 pilus assembly protein PilP [Deltaproteobacteria bacterium]MBW2088005.1 pilus assembly protein PilP [Deltaproteobacteria bacterium]MBW2319275.1 pilus assembly protein PilP [Deltaproteobacteria bacterium]
MDNKIVIIGTFICFICIFSLWVGCDKKAEPPSKSRKITKKIIIDKKDASERQLSQKADTPKSVSKISPDISKGKIGDLKEKRMASVSKTIEKIEPSEINNFYNSKGKLDPFKPLIREKSVALPVKHRKAVRRRLLTPLEKLDLSQLKLVAILRAPSGNKALVEEDSGKGYIVKKGTYIGTNAGRVINILPNKIIVEEEVEDIYGKISVRKKEIELKPPGEE